MLSHFVIESYDSVQGNYGLDILSLIFVLYYTSKFISCGYRIISKGDNFQGRIFCRLIMEFSLKRKKFAPWEQTFSSKSRQLLELMMTIDRRHQ